MTDEAALPASFVIEWLETVLLEVSCTQSLGLSGVCASGPYRSFTLTGLGPGTSRLSDIVDHRGWQPEPAGRSGCGPPRPPWRLCSSVAQRGEIGTAPAVAGARTSGPPEDSVRRLGRRQPGLLRRARMALCGRGPRGLPEGLMCRRITLRVPRTAACGSWQWPARHRTGTSARRRLLLQ